MEKDLPQNCGNHFTCFASAHIEVERPERNIRYTGLVFLIYIQGFVLAVAK